MINKVNVNLESQTRLDLIVCDHCKKVFDDQKELYEIGCVKFDLHNVSFEPEMTNVKESQLDLCEVKRVIRFHKDCLCELAGSGWLI